MNKHELENRIKELELELHHLKSGNIAIPLQKEILFRQAIEESIPSGIAVIDDKGKQVYVNQAVCNLVGWDETELLNKYPPFVYWVQNNIENINNAFQQTLNNKAPKEGFDLVFCHKTGRIIPVNLIISRFPQEDNRIFFLANVIDITERKQAEEALVENQKRYEKSQELGHVGNWEYNPKSNSFWVSNESKRIYGFDLESNNFSIEQVESCIPDREKVHQALIDLIENDKKYNLEIEILPADKSPKKIIHSIAELEKDEYNKPLRVRGVILDISERKKIVQTINKQNEELKRLNADKDRFISILGHDLKSPFNNLLGFSELLTKNIHKYDIEKIERFVKLMNDSARNTHGLLNDLLVWANSQQGTIPFEPQNLSLTDVCNDILKNLNSSANEKNIAINFLAEDHLNVFADIDMLKTVLRNLVSNAIKFTNNGGVINIKAELTDSNVIISVSDNGIGIPPENLTKLFKISEVVTTKGTNDESGTGLGLLLCKEFAEKHGGKIWVESEVDKGSEFIFTLPIQNKNRS